MREELVGHGVLLLVIAVGLWMVIYVVLGRRRAAASRAWPWVDGVVVRSEPDETDGAEYAAVEVRYRVQGRTYYLRQPNFVQIYGKRARQHVLDRHPLGATVRVRYSPNDPSVATTMPGEHGGGMFMVVFGAVVVAIAAYELLFR